MAREPRGRAGTARADASPAERLFARELQQLREIGFAEGLPLSDAIDAGDALRLECGSIGVAVEFSVREHERHIFRIASLAHARSHSSALHEQPLGRRHDGPAQQDEAQ